MVIIMLGAPGTGKGTVSAILKEKLNIAHVSSGDIFRKYSSEDSELGREINSYLKEGNLVPDELTIKMIKERLAEKDVENGVILDGFPRTIPQAEVLDKALAELGESIDYAIDVDVPDENIVKRMSGRRACVGCGATYHIVYNPTKVEGKCDACGADLILRDDDKPETVLNRLKVYHDQTQPLIDYYTKKGVIAEVDGTKDMQEVFDAIVDILGA